MYFTKEQTEHLLRESKVVRAWVTSAVIRFIRAEQHQQNPNSMAHAREFGRTLDAVFANRPGYIPATSIWDD